MGCKRWTADAEIAIGRVLHRPDSVRVERPLDPGPGAARGLQGRGVHDLVGGLPKLGVVEHGRRLVRLRRSSFPEDHHLIEAPAVQVRPDGALQVVDEGVDVAVWRGPFELAVLVGDKWSLLILRDMIFGGRRHFRELLSGSQEGIASNILAHRLKSLVEMGMLSKRDDTTHKQKVIYSLTDPHRAGTGHGPTRRLGKPVAAGHRRTLRPRPAARRRRSRTVAALHGRATGRAPGRPCRPATRWPYRPRTPTRRLPGSGEGDGTADTRCRRRISDRLGVAIGHTSWLIIRSDARSFYAAIRAPGTGQDP